MQKTALVLGGGGSRGAYQIGVWQALIELGINIDIVTGTSVGALNSALVAMGNFDNAVALWKQINTAMVLDVDLDESLEKNQKINLMMKTFLKDYATQGGVDAYPLRKMLDQYCDEEKIRNSPIECGIVVFDKRTLKPLTLFKEDIKDGQLNDYLLASSSLYPAIKSCEIDGNEYIDGGYYDNLPIELATKKGAERVIAVDLEAIGVIRPHTLKLPKDLKLIRSYWNLGPLLVFDNETILKNIRLGYLDTMKAYSAFEGTAFTFINGSFKDYVKSNRKAILEQNSALNLTFNGNSPTQRELLFHLKTGAHLKLKYAKEYDHKYSSFLKACAETAGEIFEVDMTKIYSAESFNEALIQKLNQADYTYEGEIDVLSKARLRDLLNLLDKKVRTIYMGSLIKKSVLEGSSIDLLRPAMFLTDEALASYYIALIS